MTEIYFRLKNNVKIEIIHCMGQSRYQAICINPSYMELDPVLPNAESSSIIPFIVKNLSEKTIEIYSLDFDPQYLNEDQILRNCQNYDENGIMQLKIREAGEPFWNDFLNESIEEIVEPSKPIEIGPLIILYGAPFSGKTTQGRLLAKRYKCPIVDIQDLIILAIEEGNLSLPMSNEVKEDLDSSLEKKVLDHTPYMNEDFTMSLQILFKACLEQPGSNNGIIFDGLNSNHVPVLILIKNILISIGLQQIEETIVVSPANEDIPEKKNSKIVWKGEKLVYVIKMGARNRRLYHRYLDLEDQHHSRVRKYKWPPPKKDKQFVEIEKSEKAKNNKGEMNEVHKENLDTNLPKFEIIDGVEIDTNLLIPPEKFNMPYPWYLAFPTPEEVDRYYNTEEEILKELGDFFESFEGETPKNMLVLTITDSMQDENSIYEEIISSLPMPWDHDIYCPSPETFQVIRKPLIRKLNEDFQFPFSFITKEKDGETIPTQGHANLPSGYIKKTRWVIPGNEYVELALVFWSTVVEEFEHTFKFEVLGGQGYSTLEVEGICDIPRLQFRKVTFPSKKIQISPCYGVTPRYPRVLVKIPNQSIDFGPINTSPLPIEFPKIPDTEHCYRIEVENIGQFDLHVEFQLVKDDVVSPSPIPSEQSIATTRTSKKGAKAIPSTKNAPSSSGVVPFVLHPTILDIRLDECADLCIYSYPAMVNLFII